MSTCLCSTLRQLLPPRCAILLQSTQRLPTIARSLSEVCCANFTFQTDRVVLQGHQIAAILVAFLLGVGESDGRALDPALYRLSQPDEMQSNYFQTAAHEYATQL